MAIAFDNATNHAGAATSATDSFSHTTGSGSNRLLVVCVEIADTGNTRTVSSITYNGVNLSYITRINNGAYNRSNEIWYLLNPASGSNTVAVTLSGAPASWMDNFAASYTGVAQSGQPDTSGTNIGTNGVTTTVTTVADNCWLIGLGADDASPGALTAGANTTIRVTGTQDFKGAILVDTNSDQTPAGSHSMAFTSTGGVASAILPIASFAPAGATPAVSAKHHLSLLGAGS